MTDPPRKEITMPETTPVTEMGIEPLVAVRDAINAARFVRSNPCRPDSDEEYTTKLARAAIAAIAALSTRTPEAAQVEALREALEHARDLLMQSPHIVSDEIEAIDAALARYAPKGSANG